MRFLGIDFGWQSGPSGLCCLVWQSGQLHLLNWDHRPPQPENPTPHQPSLDWVDHWAPPGTPALVAVDAPTLIPNATGMRLPDRLTHHHFRRYHAGAYPANLSRPFAPFTLALGESLEARGFTHAPSLLPQTLGRYQIEVFPHPATIHLLGLSKILKYKRGPLASRRNALNQLRQYLWDQLPQRDPPLIPPDQPLSLGPNHIWYPQDDIHHLPGRALKALEDQLDALICAYVGAHWWYWGHARNWVLGDRQEGYIIVPAPHQGPLPP